jgi:hypothetical protein
MTASRRLEREIRVKSRQTFGIQRKIALERQHQEQQDESARAKIQRREGVTEPVRLFARIHARQPVNPALHGLKQEGQERALARVDPRHVQAERHGKREQDDEITGDPQEGIRGKPSDHGNISGFNRATTR